MGVEHDTGRLLLRHIYICHKTNSCSHLRLLDVMSSRPRLPDCSAKAPNSALHTTIKSGEAVRYSPKWKVGAKVYSGQVYKPHSGVPTSRLSRHCSGVAEQLLQGNYQVFSCSPGNSCALIGPFGFLDFASGTKLEDEEFSMGISHQLSRARDLWPKAHPELEH